MDERQRRGGRTCGLPSLGGRAATGWRCRWTDQRAGEKAGTENENKRPYFMLCPCIPWRVRNVDPHDLQRLSTFLQVDTFSAWGGCHEPMYNYRGYTTWANANRWMPPLFPIQTVFVALAGYKNFEPIFKPPSGQFGGLEFHDLAMRLQKLHCRIGGRSEVRYGGEVRRDLLGHGHPQRQVPRGLRDVRTPQVTEVALHMGKYQVPVSR